MEKSIRIVKNLLTPITLGSVLLLGSQNTIALEHCYPTPYLGVEGQAKHLNWESGFGKNIFKKNLPEGNIFGGVKFSKYFAVEGGYELTAPKKKVSVLRNGEIFLGQPLSSIVFPPATFLTYVQTKGWHANLVGFLPVSEVYTIDLIGQIGLSYIKVTHKTSIVADSFNGPFNILTTERSFQNRRTIARLGAGVQYMPWDCVGLRATLGWENTHRFNNLAPKNALPSPLLIKMKNTLKPGLGAFVTFY